MSQHINRYRTLWVAIALGGLAVTNVAAQTVAPASGPDGRSPGVAPAPEATATSPGTAIGPTVRTTSPGSSGPGYGVVGPETSPGPGTRSVGPEHSLSPSVDATSPGTRVVPTEESLPLQSLPDGAPGSRAAVRLRPPTPVTPSVTATSPTVSSTAPGVSPAEIHAPAGIAPNDPSPVRTP